MFLERILESKRIEVAERAVQTSLETLKRRAAEAPDPRELVAALRRPGLGVIAEVKRASPSKGPLRPDLDAPALARLYEEGGCTAISVLTDGPHFGARPDDLPAVRGAVSVPVLRKDFLIADYQLWEARAMGADAVLLIVAALDLETLARFIGVAGGLGMTALVEVHTAEEVKVALECGARVVGINNRDLHSFRVDLEVTRRLRPLVPAGVAVVAESGISGPADAAALRELGVDAVLVGEALVTAEDPAAMVRAISSGAGRAPVEAP